MDVMVGWFPIAKLIIAVFLVGVNIYLYRKGKQRLAVTMFVILLVLFWFAPVKYDGTNTKQNHQRTVTERTNEYREVAHEAVVVTTKKKTFAERMAEEEARSQKENQKVQDEISK